MPSHHADGLARRRGESTQHRDSAGGRTADKPGHFGAVGVMEHEQTAAVSSTMTRREYRAWLAAQDGDSSTRAPGDAVPDGVRQDGAVGIDVSSAHDAGGYEPVSYTFDGPYTADYASETSATDTPYAGDYDSAGYATGSYGAVAYDTGSYDTGSYDTGSYDTGSYDTGAYDTGSYAASDAGAVDASATSGYADDATGYAVDTSGYTADAVGWSGYAYDTTGYAADSFESGSYDSGSVESASYDSTSYELGTYEAVHGTAPHEAPGYETAGYETAGYETAGYETSTFDTFSTEALPGEAFDAEAYAVHPLEAPATGDAWDGSTADETAVVNETAVWAQGSEWDETAAWEQGSEWDETTAWDEVTVSNEATAWDETAPWEDTAPWDDSEDAADGAAWVSPAGSQPHPVPSRRDVRGRRANLETDRIAAVRRARRARAAAWTGHLPRVGIVGALGLATVVAPVANAQLFSGDASVSAAPAPEDRTNTTTATPSAEALLAASDFRVIPGLAQTGDALRIAAGSALPVEQLLASRAEAERASRDLGRPVLPGCDGVPAVTSAANGRLDLADLCQLWAPGHYLRADAAVALAQLNVAFTERFGKPLTITDSYRSYSAQVSVRNRKPGLAAKPGTSEHGWGLAVDLGGGISSGGAEFRWMRENASAFGWDNPAWARPGGSGPEEPWHWEYVAGQG